MPAPNANDPLRTTEHAPALAGKATVPFQPEPGEGCDSPATTPSRPPSSPGYEILGILGRGGKGAAAAEALLAAEKAGPHNAHAVGTSQFFRAMILFRQGEKDEAGK